MADTAYPAQIQQLTGLAALEGINRDFTEATSVYLWAYIIEPGFAESLFARPPSSTPIYLLTDHRQIKTVRPLLALFPNLRASSWATNRTMHDKTLVFPWQGVSWIGTANLNRGGFSQSLNRMVRIASKQFADTLAGEHLDMQRKGKRINQRRGD